MEYIATPRFPGPPPHIHRRMDELFVVLDGTLAVWLDGEERRLPSGATLFVPRGVPHTFSNPDDAPCRFLAVMTPAGFEGYFRELATLTATGERPTPEQSAELSARYDQVPTQISV